MARSARIRTTHLLLALLISLILPAVALAEANLAALRAAGTVGERFDGFVEVRATDISDEGKALVLSVNVQRKEIYEKRAAETGVTADQVGRVYAKKILEDAAVGTWFHTEAGDWIQKK